MPSNVNVNYNLDLRFYGQLLSLFYRYTTFWIFILKFSIFEETMFEVGYFMDNKYRVSNKTIIMYSLSRRRRQLPKTYIGTSKMQMIISLCKKFTFRCRVLRARNSDIYCIIYIKCLSDYLK